MRTRTLISCETNQGDKKKKEISKHKNTCRRMFTCTDAVFRLMVIIDPRKMKNMERNERK